MRFDRVLVPLDGSSMAEAALPPAEALAWRLGSELVLVHVLERDPPVAVHGEPHLHTAEAAREYLVEEQSRLARAGIRAEAHLERSGAEDVAGAIDTLAERHRADLVAMCAHGRQTLRGRLLGPIAQRALREGRTSILLRTGGGEDGAPFEPHQILLPVDFEHDLDPALDAVVRLAHGFGVPAALLYVAEDPEGTRAWLLPSAAELRRRHQAEDAGGRLDVLARRLAERGVEAEPVVREEDADVAILTEARRREAELVVLVTHARSGFIPWYEGSIAQRMIATPGLTLLLLKEG